MAKIMGYNSSEELISNVVDVSMDCFYSFDAFKKVMDRLEQNKIITSHEVCIKKKNGELFWEAASISAILNESGEVINYIKIGEDITQQKNTAKALKKLE